MHKLISLVIGSLLGIGFALMLNKIHDDAERIEALENGIERFLCFEAETVCAHDRGFYIVNGFDGGVVLQHRHDLGTLDGGNRLSEQCFSVFDDQKNRHSTEQQRDDE